MKDIEKAKVYFANDRFATEATGICIDQITEDFVQCSVKLEAKHRNALGGVMGGVMFTLADFIFAIATNDENQATVTTVAQISYLGPCKGNQLIGRSRLLKDGKRACFYEVEIFDELGNAVALVNANGMHLTK